MTVPKRTGKSKGEGKSGASVPNEAHAFVVPP